MHTLHTVLYFWYLIVYDGGSPCTGTGVVICYCGWSTIYLVYMYIIYGSMLQQGISRVVTFVAHGSTP